MHLSPILTLNLKFLQNVINFALGDEVIICSADLDIEDVIHLVWGSPFIDLLLLTVHAGINVSGVVSFYGNLLY